MARKLCDFATPPNHGVTYFHWDVLVASVTFKCALRPEVLVTLPLKFPLKGTRFRGLNGEENWYVNGRYCIGTTNTKSKPHPVSIWSSFVSLAYFEWEKNEIWAVDDYCHRLDGPAIGSIKWFSRNAARRTDGPVRFGLDSRGKQRWLGMQCLLALRKTCCIFYNN